ncbi:hemoglobin subunit pi-like [Ruditapes philippinarum]|jgi:hemoglobin-like flavoprotein|uniref:hemoglobin subunit pi-like n=1 Tax=Ruditapes philippinarum TaxID=129788 RepID=UPI00295B0D09|nr:hemoglobin subunit pi-like [Ruditapes philippinarum]
MGCSMSTVSKVKNPLKNGKPTTIDSSDITENHKVLIKKTWKIVSNNMPSVGAKIFLRIFTIKPAIKHIFPFRDVTGDALLQNSHFRGHASRFMQAVGAAVDNINALDTAMAPLLFGLGQQHTHYKGFSVEYFNVFSEAIKHVLEQELRSKFTPDVQAAWSKMIDFIIFKLTEGYCNNFDKHSPST